MSISTSRREVMRSFIAVFGAVIALACSAAPALSMPAYDSLSPTVSRPKAVAEPVSAFPASSDTGTGTVVVVLIGAAALVAGAGAGFGAAHASLRTRGATAS
jgi:preprotein translocase subunit SecE